MDELIFQSNNDIPFPEAAVNIHQPRLNEISLITEETFHIGSRFLNFSKNMLSEEDKVHLKDKDDFNIFIAIVNKDIEYKTKAFLVLCLMFPDYIVNLKQDCIELTKDDYNSYINSSNYNSFRKILVNMFCLNASEITGDDYNPQDAAAARVAEKIKKAKAKRNKGAEDKKPAVFSRYISILSVGLRKDKNELMNYTIPQLLDEFRRFILKQDFDIYTEMKMAGAKDIETVDNWMKDLYS